MDAVIFVTLPCPLYFYRIEARSALDIKLYSAVYAEEEMLLLPGTEVEVVGILQLAEDLWEVQLREKESPCRLVT